MADCEHVWVKSNTRPRLTTTFSTIPTSKRFTCSKCGASGKKVGFCGIVEMTKQTMIESRDYEFAVYDNKHDNELENRDLVEKIVNRRR